MNPSPEPHPKPNSSLPVRDRSLVRGWEPNNISTAAPAVKTAKAIITGAVGRLTFSHTPKGAIAAITNPNGSATAQSIMCRRP